MQKLYLDRFIKIYSLVFISIFFGVSLVQLAVPKFTFDSISEQFLWRKNLIGAFNNFRFMMGDRVFHESIVGNEGWLYYSGDKSIQDHQKTLLLNPDDLKRATNSLYRLKREIVKNGGSLLVVIAPDKNTIYPQYLPEQIPVLGRATRMDQLINFIQEKKVDIEIIDLRPILLEASLSNQVYYKTDTHWNCFGAYWAYQKVMSEASAISSYPELIPHQLSDFDIFVNGNALMGIPLMMMLENRESRFDAIPKFQRKNLLTYKVVNKARITINRKDKDLPTAMVFGDSFYRWCFNRFFESHFSRTAFVSWRDILNKNELIDKHKPDIVVVEFSERYVGDLFFALIQR